MKNILILFVILTSISCKSFKLGELGINCGVTLKDGCSHEPVRACFEPKPINKPSGAFGLTSSFHKNKTEHRVYFLDGTVKQKRKVRESFLKLNNVANFRFVETTDRVNSDIRISFKYNGSWSYVGTDNNYISKKDATMNFGWIYDDTKDDEVQRVVHHEFGHYLGLQHEHQNPDGNIQWDSTAVYEAYKLNGWSKQDVDHNVFFKYSKNQTISNGYDSKSIMHYPISASWTTNGYSVGWNKKLSLKDIEFLNSVYPKTCSINHTLK